MGKQKGVYLHGKDGNILYYSWKGIACERMIPSEVYQSPVVVAHKNANGLSTTMGGSFRKLLAHVIPYPKSMQMQTALRLALLKWLKSISIPTQTPVEMPYISGLSFNEAAMLDKCLQVPLTVSVTGLNELAVLVPEIIPTIALAAPPETDHVQIKFAAACCNMYTGEAQQKVTDNITIPYNSESIPAQTIFLPLEISKGSITILAAALEYFTLTNGKAYLILNDRFRPSEVVFGGVMK
jgi:hypothetical protein